MRTLSICAAVAITALLVGCGDDDSGVTSSSSGTSGTSGTSGSSGTSGTSGTSGDAGPKDPPPPTLGTQIDRMGRPAINTAGNNAFTVDATAKGTAKDAYNKEADETKWAAFTDEVIKNLAIYDALDGVCGNQAFVGTGTDKAKYATLAGVLVDDRLWVNTASTTCANYLGVEANATKFLLNSDCGGRKPSYEVIKLTYGLLAAGVYDATAVTDGTTQVDSKTKVAAFPYFAPPAQ